jgi:hypothetical protein
VGALDLPALLQMVFHKAAWLATDAFFGFPLSDRDDRLDVALAQFPLKLPTVIAFVGSQGLRTSIGPAWTPRRDSNLIHHKQR